MFAVPRRYVIEILVLLVCLGAMAVVASWHSARREAHFRESLFEHIAHVHDELRVQYDLVRGNQVDAEVAQMVAECSEQDAYERALNTLESSTEEELATAQVLFASCGYRDATRRDIMTLKLERTLSLFLRLTDLAEKSTGTRIYKADTELLKNMVRLERERSHLVQEQVVVQGAIIDLLRKNIETTEALRQAGEAQQLLEVKFKESADLGSQEDAEWRAVNGAL